jgi:hypothetical protein
MAQVKEVKMPEDQFGTIVNKYDKGDNLKSLKSKGE